MATNVTLKERKYSPVVAHDLALSGADPLLAKLWAARGLKKQVNDLIPIDALDGVRAAADVIARHMVHGRVVVVSDYDADGATGCAVMLRTLRAFGADCTYVVPSRFKHGYGLSVGLVDDALRALTPSLLITVDNGVASVEGVAHANALGMEVVVTDHHLPGEALPAAAVIVNPNLAGSAFPSKALAGCGVAWYVAHALVERLAEDGLIPIDPEFSVDGLLPLVALGTVADVVPLDTNNRELVRRGLARIREGKGPAGLNAIARVGTKDPATLAVTDFGFTIGPRLNAAGRMDTMDAGIECLLTDDPGRATELARELESRNKQRRAAEADVVADALDGMETAIAEGNRTVAVFRPEWHEGVVGIAAGRIKERAWRPTFVLTRGDDGLVKGSGRSIPGFHLRDALVLVETRHPGLLVKFGGHAMAAGATMKEDDIAVFQAAFEQAGRELLSDDDLMRVAEHDGSLSPRFYALEVALKLGQEVWGQTFPEPVFLDDFEVVESKKMGKEQNHARLQLSRQGKTYEAVKFFIDEDPPAPGAKVRVLYKLDSSSFAGRAPSLQLRIDHMTEL